MRPQYLKAVEVQGSRFFPDPNVRWLGDVFRPWDGDAHTWVGVLGVPFDGSTVSSRRGSRYAPAKLREYLYAKTNYSTEHAVELSGDLMDFGDVVTNVLDYDETLRRLQEVGSTVYSHATHVVALGGDHSLSYGLLVAAARHTQNASLGLIQFDAHHDTRTRWGQHSGYWLRQLLEEGVVRGNRVVQIGVRGQLYSRSYAEHLRQHHVQHLTPWEVRRAGLSATVEAILRPLQDCAAIYLTFDIDAIDQSEAPGTDYPTPGGLTAWESLYLVHVLARSGRVRWMDLMEVSPPHDIADHTVRLGAELVAQYLFGVAIADRRGT